MNDTAQNKAENNTATILSTSFEIQRYAGGWNHWRYCDEEIIDASLTDGRKRFPNCPFRVVKIERVQTVLDR